MKNPDIADVPLWVWVLIPLVLLSQAVWLFVDARKRSRYPWLWGLWGCIQFPFPLIVYWLIVRLPLHKRLRKRK